jgi:sugar lactone lactonase YvrE
VLTGRLNRTRTYGTGLVRPECVLSHQSGLLFCSDWQGAGGVAIVDADDSVRRVQFVDSPIELRPNGIALEPGGSFLVAHLGAETGGIFRLFPDGSSEALCTHIDGVPLPPANFVIRDRADRIWFTVSTRKVPRADDYRPDANTGFIAVIENGAARIVADGLGYTNELAFSADGAFAYVNETFARRVTRFAVGADATLSDPQTMAQLGPGDFPDGLVLDQTGGLWITSIVSNRVIRVAPEGVERMLEESDPDHLATVEDAFQNHRMARPHLDGSPARTLRNISSLAFGGPDMRTAFLGCLLGDRIIATDTPVRGLPPIHYGDDIGPLLSALDRT